MKPLMSKERYMELLRKKNERLKQQESLSQKDGNATKQQFDMYVDRMKSSSLVRHAGNIEQNRKLLDISNRIQAKSTLSTASLNYKQLQSLDTILDISEYADEIVD